MPYIIGSPLCRHATVLPRATAIRILSMSWPPCLRPIASALSALGGFLSVLGSTP